MTDTRTPDSELQSRIGEIPIPLPDPAYRERNRKLFTGRIPYGQDSIRSFEPAPRGPLWLGIGVAAAAAVLLIFMFTTPIPVWEVVKTETSGTIVIDGTELDVLDLPVEITSATELETGKNGGLMVRIDQAVNLFLTENTAVRLGVDRSLLGKPVLTAMVHHGTAIGTTGPNFPSAGLRIETNHAQVLITGTTFSVLSNADTTCVCVLMGTVQVECKTTGKIQMVPSEYQLFVSREGIDPQLSPITAIQKARLLDVRNLNP